MLKLIFLDFDGVLNSSKYFSSKKFKEEYCLFNQPFVHIDPKKIKLLNKLIDISGASVVVSSAWRIQRSVEELNYILKMRGAKFELIDSTPIHDQEHLFKIPVRGLEIQEYLDKIIIKPSNFVILDDCDNMAHLLPFLVQTDYRIGLTLNDVKKAVKLLGG